MSAPLGLHVIADLDGCEGLDDPVRIERAMRGAVTAAGVTLLDLRLHHFGAGQGVTGVALLAESHISIHSWPEHGYAAVDIFICAGRDATERALEALRVHLEPDSVRSVVLERQSDSTSA